VTSLHFLLFVFRTSSCLSTRDAWTSLTGEHVLLVCSPVTYPAVNPARRKLLLHPLSLSLSLSLSALIGNEHSLVGVWRCAAIIIILRQLSQQLSEEATVTLQLWTRSQSIWWIDEASTGCSLVIGLFAGVCVCVCVCVCVGVCVRVCVCVCSISAPSQGISGLVTSSHHVIKEYIYI